MKNNQIYLFVKNAQNQEEFSSACSSWADVEHSVYMDAAEQFAFEGNDLFVNFFLKEYKYDIDVVNAVAKGYACAGKERYTGQADAMAIAEGFAQGGHYRKVDEYIKRDMITLNNAVVCYAKAKNYEKVEEYYQKYGNKINKDRLVYIYAAERNHERVKIELDRGASPTEAAKGYASVRADEQVRALQEKYHVLLEITDYPRGRRRGDGSNIEQERIDQIVYCYAFNGKHDDVKRYLNEHAADKRMAEKGYQDAEAAKNIKNLPEQNAEVVKHIKDLPEQKKRDLSELHTTEISDLLKNVRELIESRLDESLLTNKEPWKLGLFGSAHSIPYNGKRLAVPEGISKIYPMVTEANLQGLDFSKLLRVTEQILEIASSKIKTDYKSNALNRTKMLCGAGRSEETRRFYEELEYIVARGRAPMLSPS